MDNDELLGAALLGAAGGLRTFTPVAMLAARGLMPVDANVRRAILAAATGELIADKLPWAPDRTTAVSFLARIGSGALCGWTVAARRGALTGVGAAALTTVIGFRVRRAAGKRTSKLSAALLEDAVAVATAGFAARIAAN